MDVTFATVPSDSVTFLGIVTFFVFLTGSSYRTSTVSFFTLLTTKDALFPLFFNSVPTDGAAVGTAVGFTVGVAVGVAVGVGVGVAVGVAVGVGVGIAVGATVGVAVGIAVGATVGIAIGVAVGATVGVAVGVGVAIGIAVTVSSTCISASL